MKAPLPILTPETRAFWQGGEKNELRIMRCHACGHYTHPPMPICPVCRSRAMNPEPVSGRAVLASFTINYQAWVTGLEVPFVIGLVELVEQPGLRLTTNIVNTPPDSIHIGMALRVLFSQADDVWLPLFEPDPT
jgi:uncharacterized OB-fold protein